MRAEQRNAETLWAVVAHNAGLRRSWYGKARRGESGWVAAVAARSGEALRGEFRFGGSVEAGSGQARNGG